MDSDTRPTHCPPTKQARRSYSTPRLDLLGGIAQVTSSTAAGGTTDSQNKGKSGS